MNQNKKLFFFYMKMSEASKYVKYIPIPKTLPKIS